MNFKKISLFLIASSVLFITESSAKFRLFEPSSAGDDAKKMCFRKQQNVADSDKDACKKSVNSRNRATGTRRFCWPSDSNRQDFAGTRQRNSPRARTNRTNRLAAPPPRAHSYRNNTLAR